MIDLFLRKGADHRLRGGHLWVYSNEVDSQRSPLGDFAAGDLVSVRNTNGKLLGSAYMEPNSLICARLYAPGEQRAMNADLFASRLETALALRQAAFDKPFYRLVYGDSDTLPGLIVDRCGDFLIVQLNNAGLERYREPVVAADASRGCRLTVRWFMAMYPGRFLWRKTVCSFSRRFLMARRPAGFMTTACPERGWQHG